MDLWIGKRKTLDRFWKREVRVSGAILAYGNGKFAPTDRGEKAVPTTQAAVSACRFALRVEMVDEWCTTKCCCKCGSVLSSIPGVDRGQFREKIRGLLRCGSNVCKGEPLKSRDWNAATNILFKVRPPVGGTPWLKRPQKSTKKKNKPQSIVATA